jgi:hypothetical protein
MKLMVAGCSFSAVSQSKPGTSWSEHLANRLGWDLVNLARQGCSNGGIRIQIEEIRRQRPDFAVITPTFWDRMEIPARAAPYDWSRASTAVGEDAWNPALQQHLQSKEIKNGYDRRDGINNVNYGNNNYNMICETIFTLAENYPHPYRSGMVDQSTQIAMRHYVDCIYDNHWKKQQDEWIITEGALQLYLDGIKFLFLPVLLWPFDPNDPSLWRKSLPGLIPDHYVMTESRESPLSISGSYPFSGEDPGYHMSEQGQKVIADNWYRRIQQDFGLV